MSPSKYNEDKLPKWARTKLWALRRNLEIAEAKIAALVDADDDDTDTFYDIYHQFPERRHGRPLPRGSMVRFVYGDGNMQHFDVSLRESELVIQGADRLFILPHASNHIRVKGLTW